MKPRWLLLSVSVMCVFVLAPAVALSQGPKIEAGCGTPQALDAVLSPGEWANAKEVQLNSLEEDWIPWFFEMDAFEELGAEVSPADVWVPASGRLLLMNDMEGLYVAAVLRLWEDGTEIPFDQEWFSAMCIKFSDEPDALDDRWASTDCRTPPGEGSMCALVFGDGDDDPHVLAFFMPWSELPPPPPVAGPCGIEPLVGVEGDVGPGSVVWEWAIDLEESELDKVAPGQCFRFAAWLAGSGDYPEDWYRGQAVYPASLPDPWDAMELGAWPDGFATLCLNACAVEFVPEPGSILLLGSGLAGLAGYASLRWRARE